MLQDDPSEKLSFAKHLFVCTNTREKLESCGGVGSEELLKKIKDYVKKHPDEFPYPIRVNKAGCLGHCLQGIISVCYGVEKKPGGQWFHKLENDEKSFQLLLNALKNDTTISP